MLAVWITAFMSTLLLLNNLFVDYIQSRMAPYARNEEEERKRAARKGMVNFVCIALASVAWSVIIANS